MAVAEAGSHASLTRGVDVLEPGPSTPRRGAGWGGAGAGAVGRGASVRPRRDSAHSFPVFKALGLALAGRDLGSAVSPKPPLDAVSRFLPRKSGRQMAVESGREYVSGFADYCSAMGGGGSQEASPGLMWTPEHPSSEDPLLLSFQNFPPGFKRKTRLWQWG